MTSLHYLYLVDPTTPYPQPEIGTFYDEANDKVADRVKNAHHRNGIKWRPGWSMQPGLYIVVNDTDNLAGLVRVADGELQFKSAA